MTEAEQALHDGERVRGPGAWLRQTRERRKFGLSEAAAALHLDQRTLEALEADDYAALPPVTFVRGYLRGYARLLGLPEAEVLQSFDRLGLNRRRPLTFAADAGHRVRPGFGAGVPLLVGVLAVLVLGGAWMVWSGQLSLPALSLDEPAPAVAGAAADRASSEPASGTVIRDDAAATQDESADNARAAETASQAVVVESRGGTAGAPVAAGPAASDGGGGASPDGEAMATASGSAAPGPAAEPAGLSDGGNPAVSARDGTDPAATEVAATADNNAAAPPTDAEQLALSATRPSSPDSSQGAAESSQALQTLSFTFTGESWMEVVDARGERLLFGLVTTTGEKVVRGLPPFQIVIGDVSQVSMRRGGEPVTLDPYTRGRVARFTLEEY